MESFYKIFEHYKCPTILYYLVLDYWSATDKNVDSPYRPKDAPAPKRIYELTKEEFAAEVKEAMEYFLPKVQ